MTLRGSFLCVAFGFALNVSAVATASPTWHFNPATGHWYALTNPGTWAEAEAEAVAAGGHLVTVDDSAEDQWLYDTFSPGAVDWIGWLGLYQDANDPICAPNCEPSGGWKWISGDPVIYTNFQFLEPNNQGTEDWAVLEVAFPPLQWNDLGPASIAYPDDGLPGIMERSEPIDPDCEGNATWVHRFPETSPSARQVRQAVYDSARGRMLIFGGQNGPFFGDTWTWDGANWSQVATTGPSPRDGFGMAYNSNDTCTYLFGGTNGGTNFDDMWKWDGSTWAPVAISGPKPNPRQYATMVYDDAREVLVLYGGRPCLGGQSCDYFDDTWEWDGSTWTQACTDCAPGMRSAHMMAYDSHRGVIVLFGGGSRSTLPTDTWEWNGTSWAQVSVIGPPTRAYAGFAFDSDRHVSVLFGGYGLPSAVILGDTWEWDGSSWRHVMIPMSPPPRSDFAMAYDSDRKVAVVFGGTSNGPNRNDTWELVVDTDCDGHSDADDNCPFSANEDQADFDGDGVGDACDPDGDNDGVVDPDDNCPYDLNPGQEDNDGDSIGDVCDADDDGDGIHDPEDNCALVANPGQEDNDLDSLGDACDPDDDNDGVPDEQDNCPLLANPEQTNTDEDSLGDACDPDDDNDGVPDTEDNCPLVPNSGQVDTDGDSLGNACDDDDDDDGVLDEQDNCSCTFNPGQEDQDSDGVGNLCDGDLDGDGVPNSEDNCEVDFNPDQADLDGDSVGDVCDPDIDGDGISEPEDNCPYHFNPAQDDNEDDGLGDVCDPDDDNDGIEDGDDNCPLIANPGQDDFDGDALGDACDPDDDDDGVPDGTDLCPRTAAAEVVEPSTGCSVDQLCPCEGPRGTTTPWRNHGKYVTCVVTSTRTLVDLGLITEDLRSILISAAAQSDCGQK